MEQTLLERAIAFIRSIGIEVSYQTLEENTFLPGLLIHNGGICIDAAKLKYPGDVLHEAGHIAVVPEADRATLTADAIALRKNNAAEEMMAIAWSYAACKHLEIDPYFVFHETGYKGSGHTIADQFNEGNSFGVPMLQWAGMTAEPKSAADFGLPAYPVMAKWMRDA
jgi:hypothetical protein